MSKRSKKVLVFLVKVLVAGSIIGWLIGSGKLNGDSFGDVLSRWPYVAAGAAVIMAIPAIVALRWHLLLRCQGFEVTYLRSFHLTLVGMFFNSFSVGLTGGDVVKAYYAAVDGPPGRRAEAVYTVGFDRFVGLYGLVLVGAAAVWMRSAEVWGDPTLRRVALGLSGLVLFMFFGFFLMWSKRFSESGKYAPKLESYMLGRFFLRFYRSVKIYRSRPGVLLSTLLLSTLSHSMNFLGIWLIACAQGMPEKLSDIGPDFNVSIFVFCVAVGLAVCSVGLPMGVGVQQWSFGTLFERVWGKAGDELGNGLATVHQVVMLGVNLIMGIPAFLLVRRDYARVLAEIQEDNDSAESKAAAQVSAGENAE